MYLKIGVHPEAKHFRLIDMDTGKKIPHVFEANDETGEYGFFPVNKEGKRFIDPDNPDEVKRETAIGNIKLVDTGDQPGR